MASARIETVARALAPTAWSASGTAADTPALQRKRERSIRMAGRAIQAIDGEAPAGISVAVVQKIVAEHFSLTVLALISARRARSVARPRQIAMYLARELTAKSLPQIGALFGGRDHTTVLHGVRTVEQLVVSDREVAATVAALRDRLTTTPAEEGHPS